MTRPENKFHQNLWTSFWLILLVDRQTNATWNMSSLAQVINHMWRAALLH